MSKPYAGLGLWVWEGQENNPETLCEELVAEKFAWLAIKAHDGTNPFNDKGDIEAYADACRKHGLRFGVWGYLQGNNPAGEADLAYQAVRTFGADFYIADAETGYEEGGAFGAGVGARSAFFCDQFRRRAGDLPVALSSFGRVDFHHLPWHIWEEHGFDFMPQAYQNESAELSPRLCLDVAKTFWPVERIYPTVATYQGAATQLTGSELFESVHDLHVPGVNVWVAQELHPGQLAGLSELVKGHPDSKKLLAAHKGPLFPMNAPRALKLTSPPTRGDDVRDLQRALNIWAHDHGTPRVKEDGVYSHLTEHATAVAAYSMGLTDRTASKETIRLIWHPWLRTPAERERANTRAKSVANEGLAHLPVLAAKYIGVHENPSGSNRGYPYPSGWEEEFGGNGEPWCGCFAGAMILKGGGHVTSRVAYTPYIAADAQAHANGFDAWVTEAARAGVGWLALFNFRDGVEPWPTPQHVGIVERFTDTGPVTIEGNTGGTDPSFGGMVAREQRSHSEVVGYARPRL